ncbi:MAG: copper homeostasis protein CutC [Acidobacteria bacterium]|nr:copper homeostasis protein CutC [Acidobacteriota bacterium]
MEKNIQFEICVDSPESALAAQLGGADRVELCDNLFEGGTTPSLGTIKTARRLIDIKLHVIIRPRGGDFLYSDIEFETMKLDLETAKTNGVDGVVIGLLTADGDIDKTRTADLVSLANPMSVTFHRAFDVCRDPISALETLIDLGIDRVLTSGQQAKAVDGAALIAEMIKQAQGGIGILACGRIDETNVAAIVEATEATEIHFTAFEEIKSGMLFTNDRVSMGSDAAPSEYIRRVTTAEKVKRVIEAAKGNK